MSPDRLYNLLPAIYRRRDEAQGEPLRALLAVLESQFQMLEDDIDRLYDDWFIETCEEWAIPYLADLLGINDIKDRTPGIVSQRARVANTTHYRRYKGTLATLQNGIQDATGWSAQIIEFFDRAVMTPSVRHVRFRHRGTVDVRQLKTATALAHPFTATARTVDVRSNVRNSMTGTARVETTDARFNLRRLGIYLWRLQAYPVIRGTARQSSPGCYTFDPMGYDTPLFNNIKLRDDAETNSVMNLPRALEPQALIDELTELSHGRRPLTTYFDNDPALEIHYKLTSNSTTYVQVEPKQFTIGDLSGWQRPAKDSVMLDPLRGRLAFGEGIEPSVVEVCYSYGFSADLGGGVYERYSTLAQATQKTWYGLVLANAQNIQSQTVAHQQWDSDRPMAPFSVSKQVFSTLDEALAAWANSKQDGLIEFGDSRTYTLGTNTVLDLASRHRLVLQAEDGVCPCVVGDLMLKGISSTAQMTLNGLRLDGQIKIQGNLTLSILHCTLDPTIQTDDPSAAPLKSWYSIQSVRTDDPYSAAELQINITDSIIGPLAVPAASGGLRAYNTIIDGAGGYAIADLTAGQSEPPYGPPTSLERCTVLGPVKASEFGAVSECIFSQPIQIERQQSGFIRYSYFPNGSTVPRHRFRCQPDLAHATDPEQDLTLEFTSTTYGDPGFCQLSLNCALEIRTGAEDGAEMGVFHDLYQAQRESYLQAVLDEYLPYGLETGILYVS